MQFVPSFVSLILLLYPYLSHFSCPSIWAPFPYFTKDVDISPPTRPHLSLSLSLSLFLSLSVSPFSSISLSFSLIFLRDNCVQALSSFFSLKRRLPSRHIEAESAFQSSMMSRTPRPNPPSPKYTHRHTHTH